MLMLMVGSPSDSPHSSIKASGLLFTLALVAWFVRYAVGCPGPSSIESWGVLRLVLHMLLTPGCAGAVACCRCSGLGCGIMASVVASSTPLLDRAGYSMSFVTLGRLGMLGQDRASGKCDVDAVALVPHIVAFTQSLRLLLPVVPLGAVLLLMVTSFLTRPLVAFGICVWGGEPSGANSWGGPPYPTP